ncbi:MAG: 3'-5' exonuclease [Cyanobacteria bacterium RM1_2_2]|nr:3'-5' exonuclease [Cyanobacteria bacterium RM1_2_2]
MEQTKDRQIAAKWAFNLLKGNFCILDTETTGIDAKAQVCQIAVINSLGELLFESLVQPTHPIPESATAIHGITNAMVKDAPSFDQALVPLLRATGNRDVVIYNAEFDLRAIRQSFYPHKIWLAFPTSDRRQT